ncbi:MAG TPA: helix-hairpin-helix domain-containing protein [Polyangiaceae bacterium]
MEHLEACAIAQAGAREAESERSQQGQGGGGQEAPAVHPSQSSRLSRLRARVAASVWTPVALKLAGMALGMLVLGGIGVASLWLGGPGVKVPLRSLLGSDVRSAWLASKPPPHAEPNAVVASAAAGSAPETTPVADTTPTAVGEAPAENGAATPPAPSGVTSDGKIILNQASLEELMKLPGVGHKRASAILTLRARLGRFKRPTDLLRVKGIGVRGLKKILPHMVVDAPPETTVHAGLAPNGGTATG